MSISSDTQKNKAVKILMVEDDYIFAMKLPENFPDMVLLDDTQRRLQEECNLAIKHVRQLEIQMAEMQNMKQLKEAVLTATSHEMRSPLSNMKMAIYMLENLLTQQGIFMLVPATISESISRYLNILSYECDRELNLVNDLLNLRILDADLYSLELSLIQIHYWLPPLVESFQEVAQAQQKAFSVNIGANLPPIVSDLAILNRIVSELLHNACKYTPSGEKIIVTVQLTSTQNPSLQIIVSNSGVEITAEQISLIFEPFYRISHSQTEEQSPIFGSSSLTSQSEPNQNHQAGLGLALVKKLVQYIQGSIEVTSSQSWTHFLVKLPLTISK
ncbi:MULTISPECIES: sensor histidine kinase [Calothrix]|uniref:histidine kinase n=2 Tax=Calothrix TaxID=1186 RepID=A0ABR8ALB7_9CYAN|nr:MULTISPECIES: HAMP domain-containing sensor histidine kinase [Calothrix]MBD2200847.1 HAMP domain-containing histidine kinase [Calothrix parietina FACHB-288]MBD2229880.1 HAMP domain-containing histidine kinase [Calothrix anomala FACHB-343]